jgi:hypothetical protein
MNFEIILAFCISPCGELKVWSIKLGDIVLKKSFNVISLLVPIIVVVYDLFEGYLQLYA